MDRFHDDEAIAVLDREEGGRVFGPHLTCVGAVEVARYDIPDYFYVRHLNLFAVRDEGRVLFVDTGFRDMGTDRWFESVTASCGAKLADCSVFATHVHIDHAGGVPWFAAQGARVYMSDESWAYARMDHARVATAFGGDRETNRYALADEIALNQSLLEGAVAAVRFTEPPQFDIGGYSLEALALPGHAHGHYGLVDQQRGVLFAGDFLSLAPWHMVGAAEVDEHDMVLYLEMLNRLRAMKLSTVFMGHFDPIVGEASVQATLDERVEVTLKDVDLYADILKAAHVGTACEIAMARRQADPYFSKPRLGIYTWKLYVQRAFAALEYLHDTGRAQRRIDDDGAAVYEFVS